VEEKVGFTRARCLKQGDSEYHVPLLIIVPHGEEFVSLPLEQKKSHVSKF